MQSSRFFPTGLTLTLILIGLAGCAGRDLMMPNGLDKEYVPATTPELLLAAEWCELKNEAGPVENIASGWHFGAEYMLTPQTAVRVGGNDGQISAGLGFDGGTWAANYSYIKDWNDESVGAFLGGSDTQQLEITASWR